MEGAGVSGGGQGEWRGPGWVSGGGRGEWRGPG